MALNCLDSAHGETWSAYNGDSCDILPQLPNDAVDFSIYSPPFGDLFVYSESANDLGNSANDAEFFEHYKFLIREKLRVTKPGRLSAVHCSDLPARKWKEGFVGTKPFSDDITQAHIDAGWVFCRRITIWRDPVVEMTRTKALNLLHKQILKDSTKSWPGMADYVLLFRKPGENASPVGHHKTEFPVDQWQKWASPVWFDISQTAVLNNKAEASKWIGDPIMLDDAREDDDEKHLCPLQLPLIERAQIMWSNPGDVVLSPFLGIGSEGVVAARLKRKFIGIELKASYWRQACRALASAERNAVDLFAGAAE
ncbi:MAG: site-specific DNA-methyltransferase [Bradyrhizobium sp.]|nr:site-specific DNA-methyltransferase [Bradyrhizobium sp.]